MKAQVKVQQMVFMLIVVTLFFALAGMFILVVKYSGLKETATELEEKNAMLLVSKLANSPEFSCGDAFEKSRTNCMDGDKIMMLKENKDKYEDFWDVSNIEIRKIFPKTDEVVCTLNNYPNCNVIRFNSEISGFDASNFVILCRKETSEGKSYNKCELAKLMISYESK